MGDNSEKMSLDASQSSSFTSNVTSTPQHVYYNSIGSVPSVLLLSGRGRKSRPTKREKSTNNHSNSSTMHRRTASRILRRRQEIRRPHIRLEQRSRDKLRASYYRLKNAVPPRGLSLVSHPQPAKTALLDRAITQIDSLEQGQQQLLAKIREVEEEAARLRQANEALALSMLGRHPVVLPFPT